MVGDDADPRLERLLEQILESGDTPEVACRRCPELLPEVRAAVRQLRQLEADVSALFPPSSDGDSPETGLLPPEELPVVPGYEVLGVLGHGGMGIVFRARHLRLNRPVALKMILAGAFALPSQRQRFLREAEAVAAINHPNIVQVHNAGETDGRPWFTMELVEGGSLAGMIDGAPQPVRQSAALVASIAEATAVAHRHGIVHRDLKPANILLTADGTPKVVDFGLARWADEAGTTLTGSPVGTPRYMAPEQARGASREIGPPTDVYALGAILYELLTGRPPFRGETSAATIQQVLADQVVPPKRLNPRVPRDLETICLKCLDKDVARRYPTAGELAEDLSRYLNAEPIRARPVGRIERCVRWGWRCPAHAALLVGSILFAGVLVFDGFRLRAARQAEARGVEVDLLEAERLARSSAWDQAATALDRAQARLGDRGREDLGRRVNHVRGAIAHARRRSELCQQLERLRSARATRVEGRFDPAAERLFRNGRADREYARAFTAAGFGTVGDDGATVASRVAASGAGSEAVAALDDWRLCAAERGRRDWLADVLRRLDADPWRNRVRDPAVWEDDSAARSAVQSAPVLEQHADFLTVLAERLGPASNDGFEFLERVRQAHASDFWTIFAMGNMLLPRDPKRAIEYYRRAVALRPDSLAALNNLGLAQTAMHMDGAKQTYRRVLQKDPKSAATLSNLGLLWKNAGDYRAAAGHLRDAVEADPDLPEAHCILAEINAQSGWPGVIALLRRAIAIDPKFARAHYLLGVALCTRTPMDEASRTAAGRDVRNWGVIVNDPIAYYQAASQFDPTWIPVTQDRARLADAMAEYRLALACDPLLARAHGALGQALLNQGEFEAALQATHRAIELCGQKHPHEDGLSAPERAALAIQLWRCQRNIELDAQIPSVVDGGTAPGDGKGSLELAEVCLARGLNGAAATLYFHAFAFDPFLAADQVAGHRYRAACAAALAGTDAWDDQGPVWRRQSLEWLRRELARHSWRIAYGDRTDSVRAYYTLSHWLTDPALASVRDEALLTRLSRDEADDCRHLWADVRAFRVQAEKAVDQGPDPPR